MAGGRKVTVAGWRSFQDHWRDDGWMNDGNAESLVQVTDVQPGTAEFEQVLALAGQVLAQDRHLVSGVPGMQQSHVLGAFDGTRCTGFLRYLVQLIGAEEGRPAVMHNGEPLREGYVEAFGVHPQLCRRGIGTALQQHAAAVLDRRLLPGAISQPGDERRELRPEDRRRDVLHPSCENDSYYFLLRL